MARSARPGLALVVLGLLLPVLMVAFPQGLRVPPPVGYLAAGSVFLAGLVALANVFCGRAASAWLVVALLSCMVLPAAWIAVGAGPRQCTVSLGVLAGFAGDASCRTAFGIGAVLGIALVLVAVRQALTSGDRVR